MAVLNLANCSNSKTANNDGNACYFFGNQPGRNYWISANEAFGGTFDKEYCYKVDSCSGGLGMSGGGCYKWAKSTDAPGESWGDVR